VFGYRKVQHDLTYPLPLADTVKEHIDLMGTTIVVLFDLVRYHKGDIQTLYNVYFYNDAAIMLPESKYEVNSLLEMLQENPNYKIRLHGHSNGNYHGKILSLGPEKNFFSMEGAVQGIGSAKDLSGQRAEVIKEYLMANGIAADRIEVKAWGGKKPLYDKHSANAKKNVRVEVEVLAE
jgi:outer membrane protein OmpA-like peptidoglycan-associated protein